MKSLFLSRELAELPGFPGKVRGVAVRALKP